MNKASEAIDMTGVRVGLLVVVRRAETPKGKRAYWFCKCDCGKSRVVMGKYLRGKEVKSCGCLNRRPIGGWRKHGHAPAGGVSPTYRVWSGMVQRATNPDCQHYPQYGGRGITICKRWLKFENFLADMGARPKGKSIDRFPKRDGGYHKRNCRWATPKEQSQNSSAPRLIGYMGEIHNLTEWAGIFSIGVTTLFHRFAKGWPKSRALSSRDYRFKI